MTETDQRALLDLVGELQGVLEVDQFRACLLAALKRAVPCEWISLNDLGPEPESTVVLIEPSFSREAHGLFARLAHENPLLVRFGQTGDGRAYRFSDVVTQDELHALALYREFYEPIGLEHQIAFTLRYAATRLLAVALSRRERDFSDAERDLLDSARPFLIDSYRAAIEHSELKAELDRRRGATAAGDSDGTLGAALVARGLTAREAEVLRWVALGRSNQAAAEALGLSHRTVEKHLERCFRKLGVATRSEAAAMAWSLLEAGPGSAGGHARRPDDA